MRSIITICTGNICRSPMAEYLLQKALVEAGVHDVAVTSSGVYGMEGSGASSRALRTMEAHGIDMSQHQAQQLTKKMIDDAEMVLVMEKAHQHAVVALDPSAAEKTFLMAPFADGNDDAEVGDPYGGTTDLFEETYDVLKKASDVVAQKVARSA